jgi:hypothetical protein
MSPLSEVIAAVTADRDADKDTHKRLPDIAERPPSPAHEDSQQSSSKAALGALGGSFPRSWSLQHPATRASFSKPPRPGSFHPKLAPVASADPATATDPFRADFRPADSEFRGAFHYHEDDASTPTASRKHKRESWLGGLAPQTTQENDKSKDGEHDEQQPAIAEPEQEQEPEPQEGGMWKRWIPFGLSEPDDDPQSPRGTTTRGSTPRVSRQNTAEGPRPQQKTVRTAKSLPHIRDRAKSNRDTSNPNANGSADPRATSQSRRGSEAGGSKWAILKPKIKAHVAQQQQQGASGVAANVTVTDELLVGGLGVLLLQMFFERDDQDRRRVPILLHHLKIRVSDSINPLNGRHAVFRIEVSRTSLFPFLN